MPPRLAFLVAVAVLGAAAGTVSQARACACCTHTGQRHIGVDKLADGRREEVDRVRFGAEAHLFVGEGDGETVQGIATPSLHYRLSIARVPDRWVFTLTDKHGRSGTLTLAMPDTMEVFEVDPRRGPEGGLGPALYREWRLSAPAAGTGVFAPGAGKGQRLTLILQGHGNSCASAADFTHWTLVIAGPAASYHLYGDLVP